MSRVIEVIRRGQRGLDGSVGLVATVTRNTGFTAIAGERGYVYRCLAPLTASFEPAAVLGNGWHCIIDAVGGAVTLDPNAAETINGSATLPVVQNAMVLVYSDGVSLFARWFFGNAYIALNGFPTAADRMIFGTGANVWAETVLTPYARTLLDDANAAAAQATLGVGMVPLAKRTASNSASLVFTEFNNAVYDYYTFVISGLGQAAGSLFLRVRTSSNGGVSYDATVGNYAFNVQSTPYNSSTGVSESAPSDSAIFLTTTAVAGSTSPNFSGVLTLQSMGGALQPSLIWSASVAGSPGYSVRGTGIRNAAVVVDAIQFTMTGGNILFGFITMYGHRAS
jgi:hypothetical protein